MIVDPELPNHPKFRRLKRRLGTLGQGHSALEYLLRIWGHCQGNQRGEWWEGKTPSYVEDIAGWEGEEGKLAEVLLEGFENGPGWIVPEKNGIRIHGWDEMNRGLISNWRNGPKGGRPRNRRETGEKPTDNPRVNQSLTHGVTDKIDREEKREGIRARDGASPEDSDKKGPGGENEEAHIPSVGEVEELGQLRGVPREYCRHFHEAHETGRYWLNGQGELKDWRKRLVSWWQRDGSTWNKKRRPADGERRADLEAQLQVAKEPGQIERLRKELEGV